MTCSTCSSHGLNGGINANFCVFFVSCVSHAFVSVHCCHVITCWERADLLALVDDVYCNFATFPCGILGQVWYLIVSFPDLRRLSYFARDITLKSGKGQTYVGLARITELVHEIIDVTLVRVYSTCVQDRPDVDKVLRNNHIRQNITLCHHTSLEY